MSAGLRRDLEIVPVPGGRTSIVIDEIGGRFARVNRKIWQSLHEGTASSEAMTLAQSAGWTRQRDRSGANDRFHPLSFRVRLFSIDRWAQFCLPVSGLFFSRTAFCFWSMVWVATIGAIVVRWDQLVGGLPSLTGFVGTFRLMDLAIIFVFTKIVHELGHAILCRRLGSRCGTFGIWFLLGFPCPYVDVSDVWRQPTPIRRAVVMAAGIWMEWIVAIIAAWVWMLSLDAPTRLSSLHVLVVCGVSTVLFNCNPLMRYDGYFVLSDLIDAANLREDARLAWRRILSRSQFDWHSVRDSQWMLASYHAAASIYRVFITLTIVIVLLAWSIPWGAWRLVAASILTIGLTRFVQALRRWSVSRRISMIMVVLAIAWAMWVPLPRRYPSNGMVRVRGAMEIFLPPSGLIQRVHCDIGQQVTEGQLLVDVDDVQLRLQWEEAKGKLAVWEQKTRSARRASLQGERNGNDGLEWASMNAVLTATEVTVDQLNQRIEKCKVTSPVNGIILAPLPDVRTSSPFMGQEVVRSQAFDLEPGIGEPADMSAPWCRIGLNPTIEFVMQIDAAETSWMEVGQTVRVNLPIAGDIVYWTTIESISPPSSSSNTKTPSDWDRDRRWVNVHCLLHDDRLTIDDLPSIDGAMGEATIEGPRRAIWSELAIWAQRALGA